MNKRIVRVRPVSKLDPKLLNGNSEKAFRKVGEVEVLDLGKLFWKRFLSLDFPSFRGREDRVLGGSETLKLAVSGFSSVIERMCSAEESAAYFRIFQSVADAFNSASEDWKVTLTNSVAHSSTGFNSNDAAIGNLEPFFHSDGGDFWEFLRGVESEYLEDVRDSIVVFDFFWPTELSQIFHLANGLRERGNVVVIDATRANEQSDFILWVEKFKGHPELFDIFDYYVAYQDYGRTLNELIRRIGAGEPTEDLENLAMRSSDGSVSFKKPKPIPENELYANFVRAYYASDRFVNRIGGKKSAYLRMFPYKCYWSSCFFCTINSTHLYDYRENMRKYVVACVDFIEKYGLEYVFFGDEAIRAEDMSDFADELLSRGVKVLYRFRTRFDEAFDDAACAKLARSWARYCGVGLECASDRVSALINKGHELSIEKKSEIIGNFDRNGIPFHSYAILGLPGETAEEMLMTHAFLKKNAEERANFHSTPNTFGLNYGSVYARHPAKFGLELLETGEEGDFLRLRFDFKKNPKYALLQTKVAESVHKTQFTSFFHPDNPELPPTDFWNFIDRSGLYYHMKSLLPSNPFRKPQATEGLDDGALLARPFSVFPFVVRTADGKLENLGTGYRIDSSGRHGALSRFDPSRTFEENYREGPWHKAIGRTEFAELVRALADKGFFILKD